MTASLLYCCKNVTKQLQKLDFIETNVITKHKTENKSQKDTTRYMKLDF